jgi:hypothetical protein
MGFLADQPISAAEETPPTLAQLEADDAMHSRFARGLSTEWQKIPGGSGIEVFIDQFAVLYRIEGKIYPVARAVSSTAEFDWRNSPPLRRPIVRDSDLIGCGVVVGGLGIPMKCDLTPEKADEISRYVRQYRNAGKSEALGQQAGVGCFNSAQEARQSLNPIPPGGAPSIRRMVNGQFINTNGGAASNPVAVNPFDAFDKDDA